MIRAYPACFYKEKDNSYTVIFPDLNFLATQGENLEKAMISAIDCMAGYLYMEKNLPKASDLMKVNPQKVLKEIGEEENQEAFVNIVAVDVEEYAKKHFEKSVKKTLTIPIWLDDMAKQNHINFSQVLQNALKERLGLKTLNSKI